MLIKSQDRVVCDVLVIGGGGAGLRSAIAARQHHSDVLLVSKTAVGPNTNTYISKAVIAASGWGPAEDSPEVHFADTMSAGRYLNEPQLVSAMVARVPAEIAFLQECGVPFEMRAGKPRLIKTPGHRYARHVHGAAWRGSEIVLPLRQRARQTGVRFAEHLLVTRLIAAGPRICGAAAVTPEGRFYAIQAGAVVLATGGYAQIYLNTNNVPGITGDGLALAYELGLALKDMEFVQFYPTATGRRGGRLLLYERLLAQPGVILRNRSGQDILKNCGITDPTAMTRDQLAQLLYNETIQEETPGSGLFMDMQALPAEKAGKMSSLLPASWWKGHKVLEIAPTAHFCMGGIATDQHSETALEGLFAVGEAAAGIHGANRLGGNALAEIFAMGFLAGQKAAQRALTLGPASVPEDAFSRERARLETAYCSKGKPVKRARHELKQLMWRKAGVIRRGDTLRKALEQLQSDDDAIAVSTPRELIRLLSFRNMRLMAELVCRAALVRTESRGSHFRGDYPREDNRKWLANIVIKKTAGGPVLESVPANTEQAQADP